MPSKPRCEYAEPHSRASSLGIAAFALSLCLGATGCLSSLNKHSLALAGATAPVVEQTAAAYRDAEALYDRRVDYSAPARFDDPRALTDPQLVYDPRTVQPLMPERDIQIRLAVLAAFQCYAEKLVSLTSGTKSPELDAAAKSVGGAMTSLGNTLAPAIESTLGIVTATASTTQTTVVTATPNTTDIYTSTVLKHADALSPAAQSGITVAAEAFGIFLNSRKIKREVPAEIKKMDPHLQALCAALEGDIDTLRAEEQMDFNIIRTEQNFFLRTAKGLDPERRREQIMLLPRIVREQLLADHRLVVLKESIKKLAFMHSALAAAAQGNNPRSLKEKLSDLTVAGNDLGKFYGTLASK